MERLQRLKVTALVLAGAQTCNVAAGARDVVSLIALAFCWLGAGVVAARIAKA